MSATWNSQKDRARHSALTSRRLACWIAGVLAVLTAGASVYCRMFTGFLPYDDEGYVLISLRSLLNGHRLYDDVYSQYGPFFYLAHWVVYSVIGQPVSHDTQRFIGVALWLFSAILWGRTVYLLTHSALWSGFGFLLGVRLLGFFPWSAGHPEETCMALLSGIAVLACSLMPGKARGSVAALACLIAAVALTKVNLGLYVACAMGLVLLKGTSPTPSQRLAVVSLRFAGLVLPAALMSPMFEFAWARGYAFVATASIGSAMLIAHTVEPSVYMTGRIWRTAVLCFTGCTVLIILPFCLNGTTLPAVLQMTVLQHAGSARHWYSDAPVTSKTVLWTVVALAALAMAYIRRLSVPSEHALKGEIPTPLAVGTPQFGPKLRRLRAPAAWAWVDFGVLGLKTIAGLTCLFVLTGDTLPTNAIIFRYCVPLAWLILIQPANERGDETRGGRIALCLLAVFVYLYAYPVAGSQVGFANVPAGIVAIVVLRDATLGIATSLPAAWLPPGVRRTGTALGFALLAALLSREFHDGYRSYTDRVCLGMPGATHIRVKPQVAATYRWITSNVASCSALYSMPGMFSLNIWTAKDAPTNLTLGNWVTLLNASQQRTIIRDLSGYQGLCIIYSPAVVEFWRRDQDLSQSPLAQYILSEFVSVADSDGYFILKRKTVTPFH